MRTWKMENTAIYIRKSEERSYSTYIICIYKHFYSSNQISAAPVMMKIRNQHLSNWKQQPVLPQKEK